MSIGDEVFTLFLRPRARISGNFVKRRDNPIKATLGPPLEFFSSEMFQWIKHTLTICILLCSTAWADDSVFQSIGLKIGYRKYTYKTYEIAYENRSFLFSKRPHDNYLMSGYINLRIDNQVTFMPSIELWKTTNGPGIIMNLDLAYSPYHPQRFHKYLGLGFSFHHISKVIEGGYAHGSNKQINLNMLLGGNIEVSKNILASIELRFYPLLIGIERGIYFDPDGSPIVGQAGLSYIFAKPGYDSKENKVVKYGFYSLVGAGLLFRLFCLIVQGAMPYS